MKFTIITATYNSEKTLIQTLKSIINQTYTDFEYIIVDGKSNDKTVEIIESYETKFREKNISFKWISEKDSGIFDAWNKGIQMSSGSWISFLGSDDYYIKNALEIYNESTLKNNAENYDLIYSNVNMVDGNKNVKFINGIWSWNIFKRYMNIAHVGSFHNKKYFRKYGKFDTSYKIAGDYELLLRAKKNLKTIKIEQLTAFMEIGGVSNNQINNAFKETLKAKNKTGKINLFMCLLDYIIAHIKDALKKIL